MTMLMIETGGILVVVDAIVALDNREFEDGTKIMLSSGDFVTTSESMQVIVAKIQDVMKQARQRQP